MTARVYMGLLLPLVFLFVFLVLETQRIDRLEGRVGCIERPHGESSISGRLARVNGRARFVQDGPVTRTGCRL